MPRIGFLLEAASNRDFLYKNVIPGLKELGWSEGVNVTFEFRFSEGNNARYPQLARDLVEQKVDLIFTGGSTFTLDAARLATSTIPIVMVGGHADPVAEGVIKSFARPGGNVTGLTWAPPELPLKRVQLLKEAVPSLERLGVLLEAGAASSPGLLARLPNEIMPLGIKTMVGLSVSDPATFETTVQGAKKQRVGGIYVGGTPFLAHTPNRLKLAELFIKYQLPSIGAWNYMADTGFLMGYSPVMADQYRKVAPYIDKILRGGNPAEMPVEQPTKYELAVNLKTAKALGITVPQGLLVRADRVIE